MSVTDKEFYEVKADVLSNSKSINDLTIRVTGVENKQEHLYEISKSLSLMAQSLKHVEDNIVEVKENQKILSQNQEKLSNKVIELENAPAQETLANYKKVKIAAISAVVTMIATGIAGAVLVALVTK